MASLGFLRGPRAPYGKFVVELARGVALSSRPVPEIDRRILAANRALEQRSPGLTIAFQERSWHPPPRCPPALAGSISRRLDRDLDRPSPGADD
jgi:hypothetical protein